MRAHTGLILIVIFAVGLGGLAVAGPTWNHRGDRVDEQERVAVDPNTSGRSAPVDHSANIQPNTNAVVPVPIQPFYPTAPPVNTGPVYPTPTYPVPTYPAPTYPSTPVYTPPSYPTPQPVYGTGDTVVITNFADRGRVRERRTSESIRVDRNRLLRAIEVLWTDEGSGAEGTLLVNGERRSRWNQQDVGSPSRVTWQIDDYVSDFVIRADDDDLTLQQIVLHYEGYAWGGGGGPVYPSTPPTSWPGWGPSTNPPGWSGWSGPPAHLSRVTLLSRGDRELYVPSGTYSPQFTNPYPQQTVRTIRVRWTDRGENANGHLLINGVARSRSTGHDVESPEVQEWDLDGPVWNMRFYAEDDSIWVEEIELIYR